MKKLVLKRPIDIGIENWKNRLYRSKECNVERRLIQLKTIAVEKKKIGGLKMNQDIIGKAEAIIAKNTGIGTYCVLSLIDLDGYPIASTITASKAEGINWLTFCTGLGGTRTNRIDKCNRASVCFNSDDYNITLVGTIEILTDPAVKKEMWYEGLENHFSGPEDPNYCVLRFKTERYNLFVDWKEVRGRL